MLYELGLLDSMKDAWRGEIVATFVSDEETFGPYGCRYLMDNNPEVIGDAVLSAECSGGDAVLFGEKGLIWLELDVEGPGGHGSYSHVEPNAIHVTAQIIADAQRELHLLRVEMDPTLRAAIEADPAGFGPELGAGADGPLFFATLNIGTIHGGLKTNMIAGNCHTEVDIRVPIGGSSDDLLAKWDAIVKRHPGASWKLVYKTEPNSVPYNDEFFQTVVRNVAAVRGKQPVGRLQHGHDRPPPVAGARRFGGDLRPRSPRHGRARRAHHSEGLVEQVKVHTLTALDFLA